MPSLSEAEDCKNKGNQFLQDKNYEAAIKEYNKALSIASEAGLEKKIYYSNRSACWAALEKYENSLSDADKCLSEDSKFIKGYSRKGFALFKMGRIDEALQAYRAGLVLDPKNMPLRTAVQSIQLAQASKMPSFFPGMDSLPGFPSFLKGTAVEEYLTKLGENKVAQKIVFYAIALCVWWLVSYGMSGPPGGIMSWLGLSSSKDDSVDKNNSAVKAFNSDGTVAVELTDADKFAIELANLYRVEHKAYSVGQKGGIHYIKRGKIDKKKLGSESSSSKSEVSEDIKTEPTIPSTVTVSSDSTTTVTDSTSVSFSTAKESDEDFDSDISLAAAAAQVESDPESSDSTNLLDNLNLIPTKATSLIFLHAPVFSSEGARASFDEFPDLNVLSLDLPCHGRSTCWNGVTNEDYELVFSNLVNREKEYLGPNRVLLLSGYSPWVSKSVMEAISPFLVVWTKPNWHMLDEVVEEVKRNMTSSKKTKSKLTPEIANLVSVNTTTLTSGSDSVTVTPHKIIPPPTSLPPSPTFKDLRKLLGTSTADNIPLKQLRDILEHLTHEFPPRNMRSGSDNNVTKSILDEVIAPQAPSLVFTDESEENLSEFFMSTSGKVDKLLGSGGSEELSSESASSDSSSSSSILPLSKARTVIEMDKDFTSKHWVQKVRQFMKKWSGSSGGEEL